MGRVQASSQFALPGDQLRLLHVEPEYHSRLGGSCSDERHAWHCGLQGMPPYPLRVQRKKKTNARRNRTSWLNSNQINTLLIHFWQGHSVMRLATFSSICSGVFKDVWLAIHQKHSILIQTVVTNPIWIHVNLTFWCAFAEYSRILVLAFNLNTLPKHALILLNTP